MVLQSVCFASVFLRSTLWCSAFSLILRWLFFFLSWWNLICPARFLLWNTTCETLYWLEHSVRQHRLSHSNSYKNTFITFVSSSSFYFQRSTQLLLLLLLSFICSVAYFSFVGWFFFLLYLWFSPRFAWLNFARTLCLFLIQANIFAQQCKWLYYLARILFCAVHTVCYKILLLLLNCLILLL